MKKTKRYPKWYINNSFNDTKNKIFRLVEQGLTNEEIGEQLRVSKQTITNFNRLIKDELNEFLKTLPTDNPRVLHRLDSPPWLINGNHEDTISYIKERLASGDSKSLISRQIAEKTKVNIKPGAIYGYINYHITVKEKPTNEYDNDLEDNRLFSTVVIGSKPEALDKLKELA